MGGWMELIVYKKHLSFVCFLVISVISVKYLKKIGKVILENTILEFLL